MGIAVVSVPVGDSEIFAVAEIVVKSFKTDAKVRPDLVLDAETCNPTGLRVAILKSVICTDEGNTTRTPPREAKDTLERGAVTTRRAR